MYIYIYTHTHIYIYICIEREREGERERYASCPTKGVATQASREKATRKRGSSHEVTLTYLLGVALSEIHTHKNKSWSQTDKAIHTYIYICRYTHIHMYIHIHINTYIYIYIHRHVYISYMCTHHLGGVTCLARLVYIMRMYIYIYIYIYVGLRYICQPASTDKIPDFVIIYYTASFVFYGITCLIRLIQFAAFFATFEENMC